MNPMSEMIVVKTTNSKFVNLVSLMFKRETNTIKWDIIDSYSHDEVFVIIFNRTRNTIVCTKQFRPGLYYNSIPDNDKSTNKPIDIIKYPLSNGLGIEFCAGVIDRNKSLEEIAVNSVREECGYEVEQSNLEKIMTINGGTEQTLFYIEVTNHLKIPSKKEDVEVIEYTIPQIKDIIAQTELLNGSSSFIFGLMWFLIKKRSILKC